MPSHNTAYVYLDEGLLQTRICLQVQQAVNIRFWGSVNSLYSQISQLASSQPTFADVLLVSTSDGASVRYGTVLYVPRVWGFGLAKWLTQLPAPR